MTDLSNDVAQVLYDLDPNIKDDFEALKELHKIPESRWYARSRLAALSAMGITAAAKWNPLLHPRGPDGKFIETGGWVRWLLHGIWHVGRVEGVDGKTGHIRIRPSKDSTYTGDKSFAMSHIDAKQRLYKAPAKKAALGLPDPKGTPSGKTWVKIGGQGGSNPGGLFEIKAVNEATGQSIHGDSNSLSAGNFGQIAVKYDGDYLDDTSLDITAGDIFRDKHGTILRRKQNKLFDVLGNDFGLSVDDLSEEDWDVLVFDNSESADKAWDEMVAHAQALSTGDQFYVKSGKTVDHSKNEALANYLYELAGVNVPEVNLGKNPKLLSSKIVKTQEGEAGTNVGNALNDEEAMSDVRKDFAIDAWLANWDVVGLGLENIQIIDGNAYRIDAGGALVFRAQGSPKGAAFGNKVTELESLKDPYINPQSAKVFGKITNDELMDGVTRLAGISPEEIHSVVDATTGSSFPDLADKLVARRAYILDKYNVTDPYTESAAETTVDLPEAPSVDEPKVAPPVTPSVSNVVPKTKKQKAKSKLYSGDGFFMVSASNLDDYLAQNDSVHVMTEGRVYKLNGTDKSVSPAMASHQSIDVLTGEYVNHIFYTSDDVLISTDMPEGQLEDFIEAWHQYENAVIVEDLTNPDLNLPAKINAAKSFSGDPQIVNISDTELADAKLRFGYFVSSNIPETSDWEDALTTASLAGGAGPTGENPYIFNTDTDELHKVLSWDPNSLVLKTKNINTGDTGVYMPSGNTFRVSGDDFTYRYMAAVEAKNDVANINNGDALDVPSASSEEKPFDLLSIINAQPDQEADVTPDPEPEKFNPLKSPDLPEKQNETSAELDKKLVATEAAEDAENSMASTELAGPGTSNIDLVKQTKLMPSDEFTKEEFLSGIKKWTDDSAESELDKTVYDKFKDVLDSAWDDMFHDWQGLVPWLKFNGMDDKQIDELESHLIGVKNTTPDVPETPEASLGEVIPPGTVNGVSGKLSVHEATSFSSLTVEEAEALAESLVGKSILVNHDSWIAEDPVNGNFYTTSTYGPGGDFGLMYVESYDSEKGQAILRRMDGKKGAIRVKKVPNTYQNASPVQFRPVDNVTEDDFKLAKPPTLKSDGTIVYNGQAVGEWSKETGYWSSTYKFKVNAEHNIFGAPFSGSNSKKMDLKALITKSVIPTAPPVKAKKKSPTAKKIAEAVAAPKIDLNPDGVLSDGTTAQLGDWLQATKGGGGHVGKLVGWPNKEQYPGLVFTVDKDGVQKAVNLKTQKKVASPEGELPDELPNAYTGITLKDGKTPKVGQLVSAGVEGKSKTTGIITNINTKQGWVYIQTPEGKKVSKTYSVVDVVEEPNLIWDVDSAIAKAAAATPTPKSVKAKTPKTKGPKWPGKDGALVAQDQALKDAWLAGNPVRKLTKDGYAPQVGMRIRNNKGEEGVITEIASEWDTNPNKIKYYNIETKKIASGSTTTIEIDHPAELYGWDGNDLKKVSSIEVPGITEPLALPDGWTLYRYTSTISFYNAGQYRNKKVPNYVALGPDSAPGKHFSTTWSGDPVAHNINIQAIFNGHHSPEGLLEKIAVIDSSSDEKVVFTPFKNKSGEFTPSSLAFAPNAEDPYLALNNNNLTPSSNTPTYFKPEPAAPAVPETPATPETPTPEPVASPVGDSGVAPPKVLSAGNLAALPDVVAPVTEEEDTDTPAFKIPQPTDQVGALDQVSNSLKGRTNSITEAATKMIALKDSKESGSSSVYATGDSDYIEDMAVRYNVSKDASGNEYLVARFRVLEHVYEDMADNLLESGSGSSSKKGAWEKEPDSKFVDQLVEGDKMNVYLSGTTGFLKPKDAATPNVTVVGTPTLVGESNNYPLYRVQVMSSDGSIGEVDIEKRETPSLKTHVWNPDKVVASGGYNSSQYSLNSQAAKAGWTMESKSLALPYADWGVNVDETGTAMESGQSNTGLGKGVALRRQIDDARVDFNLTHRDTPGDGQSQDGRHANLAGEVRVRIPINGKSEDEIQRLISQSMEVVGVPVEKQAPASDEQISLFALNKLVTQYHPKYNYKAKPVSGYDDKRIQETLDHMNKELKAHLGRDVTLNDLRIHTWDSGRMQVVMSPDVAKAVAGRQGLTHYTHSGAKETIVGVLSGTTSGLMSTDERWSLGVNTSGASSATDMKYGSGDRVYATGVTSASKLSSGYVVLNPAMVATSTEVYVNKSDNYGGRKATNNFINTVGYEYMYKRKYEPEQIAFFTVYSQTEKDSLIAKAHKAGVTHIGSRPIESIIVTKQEAIGTINGPDWLNQGMDIWDKDIPIDSIIPGLAAPAAVTAAAEKFDSSAMIALVPSPEDATRLALDGYQPANDLHVTLVFLGESSWAEEKMDDLLENVRKLAKDFKALKLEAWATSLFNPKDNPCSVYLVGKNDDLVDLQTKVMEIGTVQSNAPEQHNPWIPHMAIGYDKIVNKLKEAGSEITFDRLRLAIGDINIDVPLGDDDNAS